MIKEFLTLKVQSIYFFQFLNPFDHIKVLKYNDNNESQIQGKCELKSFSKSGRAGVGWFMWRNN